MAEEVVKLTRPELYERVWTTAVSRVAPELGISDVGLRKTCQRFDMPLPPLGYWAKKQHGKRVRRKPLRPIDGLDDELFEFTCRPADCNPGAASPETVAFVERERLSAFPKRPKSLALRSFLGRIIARASVTPKYVICDKDSIFWCAEFKRWCRRKRIRPRYGAVGQHGSLALIERFIRTMKDEATRRIRASGQSKRRSWRHSRVPGGQSRDGSLLSRFHAPDDDTARIDTLTCP